MKVQRPLLFLFAAAVATTTTTCKGEPSVLDSTTYNNNSDLGLGEWLAVCDEEYEDCLTNLDRCGSAIGLFNLEEEILSSEDDSGDGTDAQQQPLPGKLRGRRRTSTEAKKEFSSCDRLANCQIEMKACSIVYQGDDDVADEDAAMEEDDVNYQDFQDAVAAGVIRMRSQANRLLTFSEEEYDLLLKSAITELDTIVSAFSGLTRERAINELHFDEAFVDARMGESSSGRRLKEGDSLKSWGEGIAESAKYISTVLDETQSRKPVDVRKLVETTAKFAMALGKVIPKVGIAFQVVGGLALIITALTGAPDSSSSQPVLSMGDLSQEIDRVVRALFHERDVNSLLSTARSYQEQVVGIVSPILARVQLYRMTGHVEEADKEIEAFYNAGFDRFAADFIGPSNTEGIIETAYRNALRLGSRRQFVNAFEDNRRWCNYENADGTANMDLMNPSTFNRCSNHLADGLAAWDQIDEFQGAFDSVGLAILGWSSMATKVLSMHSSLSRQMAHDMVGLEVGTRQIRRFQESLDHAWNAIIPNRCRVTDGPGVWPMDQRCTENPTGQGQCNFPNIVASRWSQAPSAQNGANTDVRGPRVVTLKSRDRRTVLQEDCNSFYSNNQSDGFGSGSWVVFASVRKCTHNHMGSQCAINEVDLHLAGGRNQCQEATHRSLERGGFFAGAATLSAMPNYQVSPECVKAFVDLSNFGLTRE